MKRLLCLTGTCLALATVPTASAALYYFEVPLDGAQEVTAIGGDPDGTGLAKLWIDSTTLSITWDIAVANILLPPAAAHIHMGAAGVSGPVRVDFSAQLVGGPVADPDLAGVLANPSGWYVNVHNSSYPAGAVRGQLSARASSVTELPEGGSSLGLALAGLISVVAFRRNRLG